MFQAIYNIHLRDRLRGKRLRTQIEARFNSSSSTTFCSRTQQNDRRRGGLARRGGGGGAAAVGRKGDEMVGITNLFILATAALATIIPRDTAGVARVHADIETINTGLSAISKHIKSFDADALVGDLRSLGREIIQAGKDVDAGDTVGDSEALAIIFYVKNAMAPVVDETILDLRKAKAKISKAGRLDDVIDGVRDLGNFVVVLGAALLSRTPENKRADGKEVLDGIVINFQDAVKYLES